MRCLPRSAAEPGTEPREGRLAYAHNGSRFMVTKPNDGKPATAANGGTIGFNVGDAKLAEAWHKAGVANGGTSIEDPPGVRPKDTLKKAENATVWRLKPLIFHDQEIGRAEFFRWGIAVPAELAGGGNGSSSH